jgi:hypothetical protein
MFYFIYEYMAWLTGYKAAADGSYIEPTPVPAINIAQLETMQETPEIIASVEIDTFEEIPEVPPPSPEKNMIPFEVEDPASFDRRRGAEPPSDPIRIQPKRHWKRRY